MDKPVTTDWLTSYFDELYQRTGLADIDAEGGFLVPPVMAGTVMDIVKASAVIQVPDELLMDIARRKADNYDYWRCGNCGSRRLREENGNDDCNPWPDCDDDCTLSLLECRDCGQAARCSRKGPFELVTAGRGVPGEQPEEAERP